MLEAELYKLLPPTFQYIFEDIFKGKLSRWSSTETGRTESALQAPVAAWPKLAL